MFRNLSNIAQYYFSEFLNRLEHCILTDEQANFLIKKIEERRNAKPISR